MKRKQNIFGKASYQPINHGMILWDRDINICPETPNVRLSNFDGAEQNSRGYMF